jgi:hypothetical protein
MDHCTLSFKKESNRVKGSTVIWRRAVSVEKHVAVEPNTKPFPKINQRLGTTWSFRTKSGGCLRIYTLQIPKSLNVQSSRAERKRKSQQSQRASNQSLASALNFHYTRGRFVTVEFLCGLRIFCFGSNGGPITWSCQLLDPG